MATRVVESWPRTWSGSRNREGHRDFRVVHLVESDDPLNDGPYTALTTPGLPLPGSVFNFGNDFDQWATCSAEAEVTIHEEKEGDPPGFWRVLQVFSTNPGNRCQDVQIEDPLLEPDRVSGSFSKFLEEAQFDRFGRYIVSSSFEQLRGSEVEFDANRPTVRIEQNVFDLELGLLAKMVDTVNDSELWGLLPRMVKLSNVSWEKLFYGECYVYYRRVLEFDISFKTFDRLIVDAGTMTLPGRWINGVYVLSNVGGAPPDPFNPGHFVRMKDKFDNDMPRKPLNGYGLQANIDVSGNAALGFIHGVETGTGTGGAVTREAYILVEKYAESDFTQLSIPLTL